ncbi:MAG: hypothetical protein ACE5FE_05555 [Acidiferrobacterales bacterium]
MGNAIAAARAAADELTRSNAEDGVVEAIHRSARCGELSIGTS